MNLTVLVCTYNRCESLAKALASVASSLLPNSVEWEVLVVDNNSRDQTRAVVQDFSSRYPGRFRYLFESKQGLSNARNAGILAAKGEILAFTDDDVTVDPLWLQNLTTPLSSDSWAGAAGRILIEWNVPRPSWLTIEGPLSLAQSLVQFDRGDHQKPLDEAPFGANMAFRKSMFEKYGGFRADLGRCGKSLIGNEDTEFAGRLMAARERLLYVPSAIVNHPVQQERLTKKFFRSYFFAHGRSMARESGFTLSTFRIPRYCYRNLKRKLRWISSLEPRWMSSAQGRFFCELHVLHTLGQIAEGYRRYTHSRAS